MKTDHYLPRKTSSSLAKLLKVEEYEIIQNKHLFCRVDPYTAKCLEHLSQISEDELKISAALSLNYLINYKESAFEE